MCSLILSSVYLYLLKNRTKTMEEGRKYFSKDSIEYFFYDYEFKNPFFTFFLMILTFGLYSINWIFQINKKLLEIDEDAPNPNRAAIVLFILPVFWGLFVYVIELFFIPKPDYLTEIFSGIVKILGWGLISFLSLKYVFDFCQSYGRISETSGIFWYFMIYPGYFSLIFTAVIGFDIFVYTIYFLLAPVVGIPLMQKTLNDRAAIVRKRVEKNNFNYMERKNSS